ncbi:hypothetical protein PAJ34TS1_57560 [Paenibacillus azoreducens]|uniref:Uncharacterized protein n=1 Tax=Paenibacillus azoreducens TaxID=116718 RepID=A0A919YEM1_9BACL|nr:hypothetical protein J34TS1_21200 [Paenibacillus azoreducens]
MWNDFGTARRITAVEFIDKKDSKALQMLQMPPETTVCKMAVRSDRMGGLSL